MDNRARRGKRKNRRMKDKARDSVFKQKKILHVTCSFYSSTADLYHRLTTHYAKVQTDLCVRMLLVFYIALIF